MNHRCIVLTSCLAILILLATMGLSCGKGEEEEKATVTIGLISDLTGPAAPALIPISYALYDVVDYYNTEELIPGVEIKTATYDAKYDPSRDIPGWEWVRGKGAKLIYTPLPTTGESLKVFAQRIRNQ